MMMNILAQGEEFAFLGPCCCIGGLYGSIGLVGLLVMVFWIWMIVDAATKEPSEGNDKIMWVLIIVLTSWIGALIYYFVRRPERIRKYGR